MQWKKGGWKMGLPNEFVKFVKFLRERANGRLIIGWGMSRGAKWLIELVREHAGLLDGAVMFAGYPHSKGEHEQVASAQELIATRHCQILMVHFVGDECCGVSCFPQWHAEFVRHMADPHRKSPLVSVTMPGNHGAAHPMWHWTTERALFFDLMWRSLVPAH